MMKNIIFSVPPDQHQQLKVLAALEGKTIADLLRESTKQLIKSAPEVTFNTQSPEVTRHA